MTQVENGQADWMFEQPPTDRLGEIGSQYADYAHVNPLTAMYYVVFNTNLAPFNNEKARQAVNFAIDRAAAVKLFGGSQLAQPVCQILPPDFPGHVDYCPYTKDPGAKWSAPDLDKAKQLMQESGVAGQSVTLIVEDNAVGKALGTYVQSVLNDLGFKAALKPMSNDIQFTYIQNTKNNVQISISEWYQDYPAASDFLHVLLSCDSFHPGSDSSVNIAGYCNKDIDAEMNKAMTTSVTDLNAANAIWAQVDKDFTDHAPLATLITPKHLDFTSKRLGNFEFNPQYYWMVTQSWVQ